MTRISWLPVVILACVLFRGMPALGDGGVLLLHKQAGDVVLSVFGAPVPLRAGAADLSVLVQGASDGQPILDAEPKLQLSQAGRPDIVVRPTHAQATNKLLYATQIDIPSEGAWELTVTCRGALVAGSIAVLAMQPAAVSYWPYFAVVPAAILLFVLNQSLKRRRRIRNPLKRP